MKQMHFLNVVPFFPDDPVYMAQQARRIASEVGLRSVAFCIMLHPEGDPAWKKAEVYAAAFAALKEELKNDSDIQAGILLQSLIGHGWSGPVSLTNEPWQKTVKSDGTETARFCPQDRGFRNYVLKAITGLVVSAPAFLLVDDDFCNKPGECFCPLHMELYAKRLKREWPREGLVEHLKKSSQSDPVVKTVTAVLHEVLESFAVEIRAAIDRINPKIRCGFCCPGTGQYNLANITRALAGSTEPFLRTACAIYGATPPTALPRIARYIAVRTYAAEGIRDLLAESDTFPHNRYSESAVALHTHITLGILHGLNGSKLWNTQIYDKDPASGYEYERIMARNMKFYDALLNTVDGVVWQGPETPISDHRRDYHPLDPCRPLEFPDFITALLGRFGIPTRYGNTLEPRVRLLAGDHPDRFTDDELRSFFQGGLLLDGVAATRLAKRGFSELMGVTIGKRANFFHNEEIHNTSGKRVHFTWEASSAELIPAANAQEVTTLFHEVIAFVGEKIRQGAGMVFFTNRLGGRVATVAFHTTMPFYKVLLPIRQKFLVEALDFLAGGQMAMILEETQDVMVRHGVLKDGSELLSIINLSADPLNTVHVRSSRPLKSVFRLSPGGVWAVSHFIATDQTHFRLAGDLASWEPAVFKLTYQ